MGVGVRQWGTLVGYVRAVICARMSMNPLARIVCIFLIVLIRPALLGVVLLMEGWSRRRCTWDDDSSPFHIRWGCGVTGGGCSARSRYRSATFRVRPGFREEMSWVMLYDTSLRIGVSESVCPGGPVQSRQKCSLLSASPQR